MSAHFHNGLEAWPQRPPLFVAPQPVDPSTGRPVIQRVLIANRGEIACRVIATCRKLQIKTVVLYVEEDLGSLHVIEADEAINIGSIDDHKVNPFLNIDLLIQTALDTKANAVHPGYGYLSENAEFATRVRAAGLIFIGPGASAMQTLGDKRSSKKYLQEHAPEIPLIPGFAGSSQQVEDLQRAATQIGFPVMLKASAGGGGKGMRIVREASQLRDELSRAQSEAERSFGSSDCILEKYVESSKHVEVQIVGDQHGNTVSFYERDCSVQRRHQKVVEESPCPFLTEEIRREMGKTAVRIGRLIGYENAGTVEFVVDVKTSKFYFLEVNARLQVEHPITEEVTGVDLVALQLFVAAGGNMKSLPKVISPTQTGHAIECRLCAEDPQRDFFPEQGHVYLWKPADGPLGPGEDVRYETAIQTGSTVSIYFDSMIAKLVVWAPTRTLAIQKLSEVLANTACIGVRTNQLFLQRCLQHPAFSDPKYNTSFIPQNLDELLQGPPSEDRTALRQLLNIVPSVFVRKFGEHQKASNARKKPFASVRKQFRNQHHDPVNVHCDVINCNWPDVRVDSEEHAQGPVLCLWMPTKTTTMTKSAVTTNHIKLIPVADAGSSGDGTEENSSTPDSPAKIIADRYNLISNTLRQLSPETSPNPEVRVLRWVSNPGGDGTPRSATIEVSINGRKIQAHCATSDPSILSLDKSQSVYCHFPQLGTWVNFQRDSWLSYVEGCRTSVEAQAGHARGDITAPMPCKVLSVLKKKGDQVEEGEVVMVIESMKMEVTIKANKAGSFESSWTAGDAVDEGKVLCKVT